MTQIVQTNAIKFGWTLEYFRLLGKVQGAEMCTDRLPADKPWSEWWIHSGSSTQRTAHTLYYCVKSKDIFTPHTLTYTEERCLLRNLTFSVFLCAVQRVNPHNQLRKEEEWRYKCNMKDGVMNQLVLEKWRFLNTNIMTHILLLRWWNLQVSIYACYRIK